MIVGADLLTDSTLQRLEALVDRGCSEAYVTGAGAGEGFIGHLRLPSGTPVEVLTETPEQAGIAVAAAAGKILGH